MAVQEAIHPDRYPWDAVIFDEAHNLTPTARTFHQVAEMVASKTPHALFMTATLHRGDEWTFRRLLNLVDPSVFPAIAKPPEPRGAQQPAVQFGAVKPGSLHFLRRMKEQLVDYDERRRLFEPREAVNVKVNLDNREDHYYEQAIALVDAFYPARARGLAKMVYGKRAASSLSALAETLHRRRDKMGTPAPPTPRLRAPGGCTGPPTSDASQAASARAFTATPLRRAFNTWAQDARCASSAASIAARRFTAAAATPSINGPGSAQPFTTTCGRKGGDLTPQTLSPRPVDSGAVILTGPFGARHQHPTRPTPGGHPSAPDLRPPGAPTIGDPWPPPEL